MTNKITVILVMLLAVGIAGVLAAERRDILVSFAGGIGVIPVQNVVGAAGTVQVVSRNIVRGVAPALGPWRIADLKAVVDVDGRIRVKGRGLLLASSDRIGQNANQSVFATLICEAAAPFVERSTDGAGVALELNGDFRIDDMLNPAPQDCASPVLLIRTTATGTPWFAAGIPNFGEDN
jgi:hypothetical protein